MRLKLKNEKIKTCLVMFAFACFVSVTCLCLLPLTVHAETTNQYPVPFGFGSGYGYDLGQSISGGEGSTPYVPTDEDIANIVSVIETNKNATCYGLFVREFNNDNYSFYFTLTDFAYGMPNNTYPSLGYWGFLNCWCFGTRDSLPVGEVTFIPSTGNVIVGPGSYDFNRVDLFIGDGSSAYAYSGSDIPCYPVWHINNSPIQVSPSWSADSSTYRDGFVYIGNSGGGGGFDGPGFITGEGTGTLDPDTGDLNIDFNLQYDDSVIQGKLDTIIENQEDSLDKQDTTNNRLGQIWQAITDYFTPPTQQEVTTALQGFPVFNDLTNTIGNTKTTVNSIFDFSQIQPKTADNVDFDYDFHWKVYNPSSHSFVTKTTTVHIVFSWFESVRTPVTLVLSVFLALGFLIYIFRQIPNLINGVGGGASAGISVAEHMKGSDKK